MTLTIDDIVVPKSDITVSGFVYNRLQSWISGGTSKSSSRSRDRAHGSTEVDSIYFGELVVTFSGVYVGNSEVETQRAKEWLTSKKNNGRKIKVTVTTAAGRTSRNGNVIAVDIPHTSSLTTFEWSVDVQCRDPRRYGDEIVKSTTLATTGIGGLVFPIGTTERFIDFGDGGGNGGRVSLTNSGTAPAAVLLEVGGGVMSGGFIITDVPTGKTLKLTRLVPSGSTIYMNTRTGSATIDLQSSVTGQMTRKEWFTIPAGATHDIQFTAIGGTTGNPRMTARLSPTFE